MPGLFDELREKKSTVAVVLVLIKISRMTSKNVKVAYRYCYHGYGQTELNPCTPTSADIQWRLTILLYVRTYGQSVDD